MVDAPGAASTSHHLEPAFAAAPCCSRDKTSRDVSRLRPRAKASLERRVGVYLLFAVRREIARIE